MTVCNMNQFEGHAGSAVDGIFVATGRAKAAMTAERDKFKLSTVRTPIHRAAECRIATVDHLIDIFHLSSSGMKSIFNFLIIVCENLLKFTRILQKILVRYKIRLNLQITYKTFTSS